MVSFWHAMNHLYTKLRVLSQKFENTIKTAFDRTDKITERILGISAPNSVTAANESSLELIFGPKVRYKTIPLKVPGALIVLLCLAEAIGYYSLIRELAEQFRKVTRSLWTRIFDFSGLSDIVRFDGPQLDLLTLASIGVLTVLLADKDEVRRSSLNYHFARLSGKSTLIQSLGAGFSLLVFICVGAVFWLPNVHAKILAPNSIVWVFTEVAKASLWASILILFLLSRLLANLIERKRPYQNFKPPILYFAGFIVATLWLNGFVPNNNLFDRNERLAAYFFGGIFTLIYLIHFIRAWTVTRDVLYVAVVLFSTNMLLDFFRDKWGIVNCHFRTILDLPCAVSL
jgi:hypothetical protein